MDWSRRWNTSVSVRGSRMVKPPITWVGNKERYASCIISIFPPELDQYGEPFSGSAAVLLALPPDPNRLDIYNDLDADLVNFFSCVKERTNVLMRELEFLPIQSRATFEYYRDFLMHKDVYYRNIAEEIKCLGDRSCFTEEQERELRPIFDERLRLFNVKRAAAYYLAIRGSFSGTIKSYGVKGVDVERFLGRFPAVSRRLKNVPLENKNALRFIRERDRVGGLLYCDPPYVNTERIYRASSSIRNTKRFHVRLWQVVSGCEGYVVLSYNDCPFIRKLYSVTTRSCTCAISYIWKDRLLSSRVLLWDSDTEGIGRHISTFGNRAKRHSAFSRPTHRGRSGSRYFCSSAVSSEKEGSRERVNGNISSILRCIAFCSGIFQR